MIKSKFFSKKTNLICIADDSGLEVDLLNKAPGIYSARWGGVKGNFSKARPYKNLAQASLKDLEKVDGLPDDSAKTWGSLARQYSRRYNEVFQRPVVKNILQRGPKGAREELTFDAAIAPKVKGKINLRDFISSY